MIRSPYIPYSIYIRGTIHEALSVCLGIEQSISSFQKSTKNHPKDWQQREIKEGAMRFPHCIALGRKCIHTYMNPLDHWDGGIWSANPRILIGSMKLILQF